MQEGSRKATLAAFFANAAIAVTNQGLLLLGCSQALRVATPEHPFGYGRERSFWSFVGALVIFTLGSLFALYEGFEKLRHPHELESVPRCPSCCWRTSWPWPAWCSH